MSNSISSFHSMSNAGYLRQAEAHDKQKRVRQDAPDMQALSTALQAGDMSAAQSAYATLKQNSPNLIAQADTSQSKSPRAQVMKELGAALDAGDLPKAQSSFAELQKTLRGQPAHRHEGLSEGKAGDSTAAVQSFEEVPSGLAATSTPAATPSAGSLLNVLT